MAWTTVERGPLLTMEILRAALDDAGIPSLIPDGTMKTMEARVTARSPSARISSRIP